MNFIDCVLKKDVLDCGDFTYPLQKPSADRMEKHGTRFHLGIRPEHVQVSREKKTGWIRAELQAVEHLGNMQLLHLSAGKHEIKAKLETWEHGDEGSAWIRLPDEKVKLFRETGELIHA